MSLEISKEAMDLVRAQAAVRPMTADEMITMAQNLTERLAGKEPEIAIDFDDAKKAIGETSVRCMECGKVFKVITRKHLLTHGLTPREYRDKYGYKSKQPLAAKKLCRDRRKKMNDMELWKRRGSASAAAA